MFKMIERLIKYRYNKNLIKNLFKSGNRGRMTGDHIALIDKCATTLLVTFIIRYFGGLYINHNLSELSIIDFLIKNIFQVVVLFGIYTFWVNYLLGVGFKDKRIKLFSNRFVFVLVLIVFYIIECITSIIFFMKHLYDFYAICLIALISVPVTLFCYFGIFISIMDFVMYSTDNSDDNIENNSERIDYF